MTEKAMMIKQLKFYVDTYENEKKHRYGELNFIDLFTGSGIQMSGVCNIFKIAKLTGVDVKIMDFHGSQWGKKVSIMYEGVNFFALGTDEEVEEVSHE